MSEIKAAHRKLALEHHPDKTQGRGASKEEVRAAEERFKEIQAAFETLSRLRVRG
jgi:curved DNA-binding protein CbpA